MVERALTAARRPLAVLGLLAAASTALRCFRLGRPPGLMGDEIFYVNAARDILGHHAGPPGAHWLGPGLDSVPEHPPLAKLLIAASIHLFGDNPVAWRLPSVIFGTAAILLTYALVRAAGGRPALALTAAAVMSVDNLVFVHGRMATLDIFVLTFMLASVTLYLRGRWVQAGAVAGLAAATKLVGADVILVVALIEGGRLLLRRRRLAPEGPARPRGWAPALAGLAAVAAISYLTALGAMDHFVGVDRNPVTHTQSMLSFLSRPDLTATTTGQTVSPSSTPDQWFVDQVEIPYWVQPAGGPAILAFQALISPPIIFAAIPALVLAALALRHEGDGVSLLALAWLGGTLGPFVYGAMIHRTSYLYYMVIVLPAIYIAIARCLLSRPRLPDTLRAVYVVALVIAFVALFPVRSWSGG